MQFKRSWPIGESKEVLERRWQNLLTYPPNQRGKALRETDARDANRTMGSLDDSDVTLPAITSLAANEAPVDIRRYAFRSFDRHWMLRVCRLPKTQISSPPPPTRANG